MPWVGDENEPPKVSEFTAMIDLGAGSDYGHGGGLMGIDASARIHDSAVIEDGGQQSAPTAKSGRSASSAAT